MVYTKTVLSALLIAACPALSRGFAFAQNYPPLEWQSPAQFRQPLKRAIKGTLLFDNDRIRVPGAKVFTPRWPYGKSRPSISPEPGSSSLPATRIATGMNRGNATFRFKLNSSRCHPALRQNYFARREARHQRRSISKRCRYRRAFRRIIGNVSAEAAGRYGCKAKTVSNCVAARRPRRSKLALVRYSDARES